MIWHIYTHLYCSSRDDGRDLPSLGEAAPTMGQVPCEFRADQTKFIFQPVAPDMIWYIYSGQRCFHGVLGMDLLSSGYVALTMGQFPCEFRADRPTFIAGSLEAAYSLNWGAREIWGKGGGETLALL